jgi:hypothetical protein
VPDSDRRRSPRPRDVPSPAAAIPAATARPRYSWIVPSPIPQLRAIWRCPNPTSNLKRRTSLTFRMDFLLAGTLSSFIDGVSMPGDCPASLHLLLWVCGKHSAPSRTPFRQATKTVRLPRGIGVHLQTGMLFGITTESCSASERNRVHLRPDTLAMRSRIGPPKLGQPIHGRFVFLEAVKDDIHSKVGLFARSWCRTSVRNWARFRRCRAPQGRMGARHERAEPRG